MPRKIIFRFLLTLFVVFCVVNVSFNVFLSAEALDSKAPKESKEDKSVSKLELAGSESGGYDVGDKIRRAKSSVNIGLGLNIINNADEKKVNFNSSVTLGYSYFFLKNLGVRGYALFDHRADGFYAGAGVDAMLDFLQTEPFGIGLLGGMSLGHYGVYAGSGGFLSQVHLGLSFIFDGGKSRLEALARLPYVASSNAIKPSAMYILMYSYTF